MGRKKVTKEPADKPSGDKLFRLSAIEPEYVSLVRAGANRQKSFMVVKEEGEEQGDITEAAKIIPGLAPSPRVPSATCPNCGDKLPRPLPAKCPGCGYNLKLAESKEEHELISDDQVADTSTAKDGDGASGDNNGNPVQDEADLSSWLFEAGEKVAELSMDHAIQQALDAQVIDTADTTSGAVKEAEEINDTEPPTVEKSNEQEQQDSNAKIAKLEAELDGARAELRKARREQIAMKAKVARLAKGVGTSSVMLTGEITAKDSQRPDTGTTSPSRGTFSSGGDIAAAVVDK